MSRPGKAFVVAAFFLVAFASAAFADVTVNPSSGPPSTVVTVSGVATCEGSTPTVAFAHPDGSSTGASSVPFTPPSGVLVVPNLPDGDYHIALSCGAGEGFVVFAVRATPNFTG